jgi:hypothetical protein
MKGLFVLCLIFVIASPCLCFRLVNREAAVENDFNVVKYGAKGDCHTDDSNVYFCYSFIFHFMQLFFIYFFHMKQNFKSNTIFKLSCKKAFTKAWLDVCGSTLDTPTLIIPEGQNFMLQPLSFQGPCKSTTINVKVRYKGINKLVRHA